MKIKIDEDLTGFAPKDCRYMAYDDDTYDGASHHNCTIGFGATPHEAEMDLIDKWIDKADALLNARKDSQFYE
jgi:hypothetical protein